MQRTCGRSWWVLAPAGLSGSTSSQGLDRIAGGTGVAWRPLARNRSDYALVDRTIHTSPCTPAGQWRTCSILLLGPREHGRGGHWPGWLTGCCLFGFLAVWRQARREEELRKALTELHSSKSAQESSRTAVAELEALRREERTLQQKMQDLQHSLVRCLGPPHLTPGTRPPPLPPEVAASHVQGRDGWSHHVAQSRLVQCRIPLCHCDCRCVRFCFLCACPGHICVGVWGVRACVCVDVGVGVGVQLAVKQERDGLEASAQERAQQQRAEARKHQAALLEKSNEIGALRRQLAERSSTGGRILKMSIDVRPC